MPGFCRRGYDSREVAVKRTLNGARLTLFTVREVQAPSGQDGIVQPFALEVGDVLDEGHDQRMRVVLARRKLRLE